MRTLLFVFFFSFGSHTTPPHDIAIAMFRISQSEARLTLDISLDANDLATALGKTEEEINLSMVQTYIAQHTQFEFNSMKNDIHLLELKKVREHLLIKGEFLKGVNSIEEIHIQNTCLIDIPNHSNIIQVQVNDGLRDFRMHKERVKIEIEY